MNGGESIKNSTNSDASSAHNLTAWVCEGKYVRCVKCGTRFCRAKGVRNPVTYKYCPECGDKKGG